MRLFRVFSWDQSSLGSEPGGPFYVPRARQGSGRHDNPELYGAFYCSLDPVSSVAEALQPFRNQSLLDADLSRGGSLILALATFEFPDTEDLCNLDDPLELHDRGLRPSRVATLDRPLTQGTAARIFGEGTVGLLWWSVLEALWINATLFIERAAANLNLHERPRRLNIDDTEVRAAARRLGIQFDTGAPKRGA